MTDLEQSSPTWITIDFPEDFKMGLQPFAHLAGWRVRRRGGQTQVTPLEQYRKTTPALLTVLSDMLGDEGLDVAAFGKYSELGSQHHLLPSSSAAVVWKEVEKLDSMTSFGAAVAKMNLIFTISPTEVLAEQMHEIYTKICYPFDEASRLILIQVSPRLSMRYAGVRAMLTAMVAPEELNQDEANFEGFRSARGLFSAGTYGVWPFLAPSLLALSPWVSGVMSARAHANSIWLFSRPLAGISSPSDDLIASLMGMFGRSTPDEPTLSNFYGALAQQINPEDQVAFLHWWVRAMNQLLSFATDVTRFGDEDGKYDPRVHLAFVLSLEKLFEDLSSTLTLSGRDDINRLRAAYDALDCLEGLRLGSVREMTTPSRVKRARNNVQQKIPAAARILALPRCDAAVRAIDGIIDGFFLKRHVDEHGLRDVPHAKGPRSVRWDNAVPDYLRILRNSAHSFVKEIHPLREPTKLTTFVAHDGQLSTFLPDVAWLWVLNMLADLTDLDRRWPRVQ